MRDPEAETWGMETVVIGRNVVLSGPEQPRRVYLDDRDVPCGGKP